jgi:hypothetical protein
VVCSDSHRCTIAATDFWVVSGRQPRHSHAFSGQTRRTRCRRRCWLSPGLHDAILWVATRTQEIRNLQYSCSLTPLAVPHSRHTTQAFWTGSFAGYCTGVAK